MDRNSPRNKATVIFYCRNIPAIICSAVALNGLTRGRSVIDGVDGNAKGVDLAELFVVRHGGLPLPQFLFPSNCRTCYFRIQLTVLNLCTGLCVRIF